MTLVPEQISRFVPEGRPFQVLGTDGMGRSDTREALRRFFEIDTGNVVVTVLTGLLEAGEVDADRSSMTPSSATTSIPTPPTPTSSDATVTQRV